jgi:catalase
MTELQNAGVTADIVSHNHGLLECSQKQKMLEANKNYLTATSVMYDAVFVAGGKQCKDTLIQQGDSIHFVNEAFTHAKAIGAINEGIELLIVSQFQGFNIASNQSAVSDCGVVTSDNATDIKAFAQAFINAIAQHRHWNREKINNPVLA